MSTEVTDFVSVKSRAAALGCLVPAGFGILPSNFVSAPTRQDLVIRGESVTVRKLLQAAGLQVDDFLPTGERSASIHNKNFDWAPVIFISAALLSSDPNAVSVALGVISNYLTSFFKGWPKKDVRLEIVVETNGAEGTCKKITYQGTVDGLPAVAEVVRSVADE